MWQRGIGGSSTPIVTEYPYQGGSVQNTINVSIKTGVIFCRRNDVTYQSVVTAYFINGVMTTISTAQNCSITYNNGVATCSIKSTAAGVLFAYVID